MDASRVTFFRETRQKLTSPVLDKTKRRALKIERIKEFIRSKPAGTKFRMEDLMYAAGYGSENYASGYAFITGLRKNGILDIEKTSKFKKTVTIPEDVKVKKLNEPVEVPEAPEEAPVEPETLVNELDSPPTAPEPDWDALWAKEKRANQPEIDELTLIRHIEMLAKEFSWKNDSNDLREFVRSLK